MISPPGVVFHDPDVIQTRLEQGIRSRADAVDGDCCVRARGLPWQASDQDIARFFVGLNVAKWVPDWIYRIPEFLSNKITKL